MKKNVMMRSASLLLVMVLLTSSVISGTFAKYVTQGQSTDSARVAKFGVSVVGASDMFDTTYDTDDASFTKAGITVESSTAEKVVAPGTSGKLADFNVTGTPEVAVRVSYKVDTLTLENWTTGTDPYCPIIFTLTKNGTPANYYIDGTTIKTQAELIDAVTKAINTYSQDYKANETLDTAADDDLQLSWSWQFDQATAGGAWVGADAQDDTKDTALGDRAAANVAQAGRIDIAVTCTVTQID